MVSFLSPLGQASGEINWHEGALELESSGERQRLESGCRRWTWHPLLSAPRAGSQSVGLPV